MRIRLADPALVDELVGFLQRAHCIPVVLDDGDVEVFLAHDLPDHLAHAELTAYLAVWRLVNPDVTVAIVD